MTFLAPQFLALGAALLTIPIAIHLWSRRPARTVTVGSTRLLAGARPSRARRLALTDVPLLLLRLLIFAFAGAAAAGLAWRGTATSGVKLALITPTAVAAARADSLRAAGWTLHFLTAGLPAAEPGVPLTDSQTIPPVTALLADAARAFPTADSVLVVAPLQAAALSVQQGPLPFPVTWLPMPVDAAASADTLRACLVDLSTAASQDATRLTLAFEAIAAAAGRPLRFGAAPCTDASVQLSLTPMPDGTPIGSTLTRDLRTGTWHLAANATRDLRLIDDLTSLLQLREAELQRMVVPLAFVSDTSRAARSRAGAASWSNWLGMLALLFLGVERLIVARHARGTRVADAPMPASAIA